MKEHYDEVNGFYAYESSFDLPITFTSTARKIFNLQIGSGFSMPASGGMGDTANSVTVYGLSNARGEQTITAHIYVWGDWK